MVRVGDDVQAGEVIAESMATSDTMLSLGQNILVAFMFWEGGNYEDAIVVSERLVKDDVFTSIHIEQYEVEARDTKLGPEEITRDIPNQSEEGLRNLDDTGGRLCGRRGWARRHPGRQDHAEGRNRAQRRGPPVAGDLWPRCARGQGHLQAPAHR